MTNCVVFRRVAEVAGILLIGEGVMGLLQPRRYSRLWHFGPQLLRAATEELAEHPKTARGIYLAEIAVGIAIASLQTPDTE